MEQLLQKISDKLVAMVTPNNLGNQKCQIGLNLTCEQGSGLIKVIRKASRMDDILSTFQPREMFTMILRYTEVNTHCLT